MHVLRQADQVLQLRILVQVVIIVQIQVHMVILPKGIHDIVIHDIMLLVIAFNIITATILPINDCLHVSEGVDQLHGTFLDRCAINSKSFSITARCGQIVENLANSHLKLAFAPFSLCVAILLSL